MKRRRRKKNPSTLIWVAGGAVVGLAGLYYYVTQLWYFFDVRASQTTAPNALGISFTTFQYKPDGLFHGSVIYPTGGTVTSTPGTQTRDQQLTLLQREAQLNPTSPFAAPLDQQAALIPLAPPS